MTLVGHLRASRYAAEIRACSHAYEQPLSREEVREAQLRRLNDAWHRNITTVPFFRRMYLDGLVPKRFDSLEEFAARMPPTSRSLLQQHVRELTSTERPPDAIQLTGGSTAEPVQIPVWRSEFANERPLRWMARAWYGIRPDSRLFQLWGHSHLLGTGFSGWLNARRRELYDFLLGYCRFSAYDLQEPAMRRALQAMIRYRPDYVVGYSVALDHLARAADDVRASIRRLGVRAVIATAESFPSPEAASRLQDVFNCPVAMEYGAMESGIIAHTQPSGGYRVFWRSLLLEADKETGVVRVTSLCPRSLPLVRYEIGDQIEMPKRASGADALVGITEFERVIGRCNEYVELAGGPRVHSEAMSHAVRPCRAIRSFQVHQHGDEIELRYTADCPLAEDEIWHVRQRLARIHPELEGIAVRRVERLEQTIAGKTRMVVRS